MPYLCLRELSALQPIKTLPAVNLTRNGSCMRCCQVRDVRACMQSSPGEMSCMLRSTKVFQGLAEIMLDFKVCYRYKSGAGGQRTREALLDVKSHRRVSRRQVCFEQMLHPASRPLDVTCWTCTRVIWCHVAACDIACC